MIYSIGSEKCLYYIPHKSDWDRWRNRLTDEEYAAIASELNSRIEGGTVHTSSWMPGSDWTGTVFDPIYQRACEQDPGASARFFGLILWEVMLRRPETWAFGRYKLKDIPIEGLTYFIVQEKC